MPKYKHHKNSDTKYHKISLYADDIQLFLQNPSWLTKTVTLIKKIPHYL